MKKEDKKLIINQANYEGYLQLYKIRKTMTKEEIEYSNKFIKMILIITGIGLSSAIVSAPFQIMGLASNIVETELMALMLVEVGIGIIGYKKQNDFTKKNEQKIKEKYPYVDVKIDEEELALAEWFEREEMPVEPEGVSLTNEMMMAFKQGLI